jgi:hypothetical protein
MSEPSPSKHNRPHWAAASIALFIIGLLILVPSGLCTAMMGYFILLDVMQVGDLSGILMMLFFGGVPIAVGVAFVRAALKARERD